MGLLFNLTKHAMSLSHRRSTPLSVTVRLAASHQQISVAYSQDHSPKFPEAPLQLIIWRVAENVTEKEEDGESEGN